MERVLSSVLILTAAGESRRFLQNVKNSSSGRQEASSKALFVLSGLPVLIRSLMSLEGMEGLVSIVVTAPESLLTAFEDCIAEYRRGKDGQEISRLPGVDCIAGGKTRQESVFQALQHVVRKLPHTLPERIWVHDAARCFLDQESVDSLFESSQKEEAITLGYPSQDSLKIVNELGEVKRTLPRDEIMLIQTPQVFSTPLLLEAHKAAILEKRSDYRDDAEMLEPFAKVKVVIGSKRNIKITSPEDVLLAEDILAYKQNAGVR